MENVCNTLTIIVSNAISNHNDIRVSNINRLIFEHLNQSFPGKIVRVL